MRKVQARWRGILVLRRYRELQRAAATLGRWHSSRCERRNFLTVRRSATRIASTLRAARARRRGNECRNDRAIAEARLKLRRVREKEILHLARSTPGSLVDVDVLSSAASSYDGWTPPSDSVTLAVGRSHSCALTKTGRLYAWDSTTKKKKEILISPSVGRSVQFAAVACGGEFTLALSLEGRLYSWGENRRGQLGHGMIGPTSRKPKLVALRKRVTSIAAGVNHAACVAEHIIYAWGAVASNDVGRPTEVLKRSSMIAAVKVACGLDFSVALANVGPTTTHRDVLTWGAHDPVFVSAQKVHRAVDIACGARHTLILLSTGEVLAAGSNTYGQLGLGDRVDRENFAAVELPAATAIAAGWRNSAALTSVGLYVWGQTNAGAVRSGREVAAQLEDHRDWTTMSWNRPQPAPFLPGRRPTGIASAKSATLSVLYATHEPCSSRRGETAIVQESQDDVLLSIGPLATAVPSYLVQAEALRLEAQLPEASFLPTPSPPPPKPTKKIQKPPRRKESEIMGLFSPKLVMAASNPDAVVEPPQSSIKSNPRPPPPPPLPKKKHATVRAVAALADSLRALPPDDECTEVN